MGVVLGPTQCSKSTKDIPQIVYLCCRKGDPFQDRKLCSYLLLRNELPEPGPKLEKVSSQQKQMLVAEGSSWINIISDV